MELYDEEQTRNEYNKNNKLNKILIISIVLVAIIIISLIIGITVLSSNPSKLTVNLNGRANANLSNMLELIENTDGTVKINAPIKEFAKVLGYDAYNGEYLSTSTDTDKCHVINNEEAAIFYLNSNVINKKDLTVTNSEYESYTIGNNVFEKDGVLYVDDTGLTTAFNLSISYSSKGKILNIYTLDTLVETAKNRAINTYGKEGIDETSLANKKAILDGMLVIVQGGNSSNKKYGVIDYSTGETILELRYDNIKYIPTKSEFFVKLNNKVGTTDKYGQEKIKANYDNLVLIDKEKDLYLAQNNNLYGVVDGIGKTIIYLEYNQIGIDVSQYTQNQVKSGYVLLNKLIPVKQGNKWAIYNTEGTKLTDFIYDKIGSITSNNSATTYNLLTIPESYTIVVGRDKGYNFIGLDGAEIFKNVLFTDAYIRVSSGLTQYFMVWNEKEYNIIDMIAKART